MYPLLLNIPINLFPSKYLKFIAYPILEVRTKYTRALSSGALLKYWACSCGKQINKAIMKVSLIIMWFVCPSKISDMGRNATGLFIFSACADVKGHDLVPRSAGWRIWVYFSSSTFKLSSH
jgi:hypothetical protein